MCIISIYVLPTYMYGCCACAVSSEEALGYSVAVLTVSCELSCERQELNVSPL